MYSALIKENIVGSKEILHIFQFFKIFLGIIIDVDYEIQTNEAMGLFAKWIWNDSKAEIYFEFHHNDSKQNLRDLILDSDHSRAVTIKFAKNICINKTIFYLIGNGHKWNKQQSRLIRNAGSWYEHYYVYDGYTNKGEVLGSSIGPGSNSHLFFIK